MLFSKENKFRRSLANSNILLAVYITITIIASIQLLSLGVKTIEGHEYTHYNNYIIFKQTFHHLINNQDLYCNITDRYKNADYQFWDFKYSPTFSVYMLPLAYLPVSIGLILWNLLNTLILFFSIKVLPRISDKIKVSILWFILIENITSVQNTQSNALIAGLIILAFNFLERRNIILATLLIALSAYIKPFGIIAFSLFLFYPGKIKFILYSVLWMIILFALPLLFVSFQQLTHLYQSWFQVLKIDHDSWHGLSVIGWLYSWFNLNINKNIIVFTGFIILSLSFLKYKSFNDYNFRILFLTNILIWIVIFNHRAESATFIIAATGVALWYFYRKRKLIDLILVCLAFIFTILSPTDIFPKYLRENFVAPYVLKAIPCILIWLKITYEIVIFKTPECMKEPESHSLL
ncbi:MAG: glycosyltransferase family 87 protein [Bacteroidales bacterium]|nr:glycosyltransferase family 87 protein [Bacteroidales bacterium]